jgi:protein involved in polysaccharide export with SLBB domain
VSRGEWMSKGRRRAGLAMLAVALLGLGPGLALQGQSWEEPERTARPGRTQSSLAAEAVGNRITEILRADPLLMDEVRRAVVRWLRDEGVPVSERELTEEALLARLRQDARLRAFIGSELAQRGYLGVEAMDELALQEDGREMPRYGERERRLSERERGLSERERGLSEQERGLSERDGRRPSTTREEDELEWRRGRRPAEDERDAADLRLRRPADRFPERPEPRRQVREPRPVPRPTPYPNLRSLRDLYSQVPASTGRLERFGEDVFRYGSGNYEQLPIDLPAGPDYVLGPGDGLTIEVAGSVSQRLRRVVDREGRVALPEVGAVQLAGRTLGAAQEYIQARLQTQYQYVRADVSLERLRSVRVYVVGDVERPGPYDVSSLSTVLNALYAAGGPTARGSMRTVRHYRGPELVREVDLYELILRGVRSDTQRLEPGDTILVPPVGAQVTVDGMVRRPGIYEMNGTTDLAQMVELAGGVLVTGTLRQIQVERVEAHQRRVTLNLSLPEEDAEAAARMMREFALQDSDKVVVWPILPYSEETVYLDGHVFRPGKYSFREGMTVRDLIHSHSDLLPEPGDRAEIVRLIKPEFRPVVLPFDLTVALNGESGIRLLPFDTVRVYGRYEQDPPRVHVHGEVLREGEYPLGRGMTVSELVRMAGGFRRGAFTEQADLTTHRVEGGRQVVGSAQQIDLTLAMAGDPQHDLRLKDGDVLTIRQMSGWSEIGASVTLHGEVVYPGTYGIRPRERLSSVIRRAGGFREGAYPEGAVLDRVQVRRIAEQSKIELVRRLEQTDLKMAVGTNADAQLIQAFVQQREQAVERLRNSPTSGRQVIRISPDVASWEGKPDDIELRAGDVLTIPRQPNFVLVQGQVHSPSALTFQPGRNAGWYLRQAGGTTEMANRGQIFVVRADGSVVGEGSGTGWWRHNVLSTRLQPGDTVVVPEKALGGSAFWRTLLQAAQLTSSLAITARVVTGF